LLRDEPGGSLPTGQVVSGMKVARARLRLLCGTWEPVASMRRLVGVAGSRKREIPKQQTCKGLRTDAGHRGGPPRSSDEALVMGVEPRGRVTWVRLLANQRRVWLGGAR
jgi:hypothetical protein